MPSESPSSLAAPRGNAVQGWFLLAAASVSSVALVLAAWIGVGDPKAAGHGELARVASEVEASVLHDWEQLRRGPWDWTGVAPIALGPLPAARPQLEPEAEGNNEAIALFEALLGEARRVGRSAGYEAQLRLLKQALGCGVNSTYQARARVFAIALHASAGEAQRAKAEWSAMHTQLSGAEAQDGIALWLQGALAVEGMLTSAERANLQSEIMQRWSSGVLCLPPAYDARGLLESPLACLAQPLPLRAALQRRVAALGPGPHVGFAQRLLQDKRLMIEAALGHSLSAQAGGATRIERVGKHDWVLREVPSATTEWELRILPMGILGARLEQVVQGNGVLPEGFEAHYGGPHPKRPNAALRPMLALEGGPLELTIYHSDPDSYVSRAQSKRWYLRAGLLLMAFFTAAAGVVSFRALGRERRLAGLKSAFVANVSHELRTPIASILLMAENLELGRVPDEDGRRRYLRLIRREAGRLRRLVDDVLDFSRLERGQGLRILRAPIEAQDFARSLKEDLESHVQAAGGELGFDSNDYQSVLSIDAEGLRRATLNLVDNALKHSGEKRVEVSLEVSASQLRLVVRDHGRGVEASQRENLLQPFGRSEHPEAAAGTGLGLSIVHEIARAHGGTLSLGTAPGGAGLVVELCLPLEGTN